MSQGDVVCLFKNRKEAEDFVEFVLTDEATRPVRRGYPQTLPLRGKHVTYGQGKSRYRGTDRRERVYVAVSALEHVGQTIAPACREVARRLGGLLGHSKRGRPRKLPHSPILEDQAQTVRSLHYKFAYDKENPLHPWASKLPGRDLLLEHWHGIWKLYENSMRTQFIAPSEVEQAIQKSTDSFIIVPMVPGRNIPRNVIAKNLGNAFAKGRSGSYHARFVAEKCSAYYQRMYRESNGRNRRVRPKARHS